MPLTRRTIVWIAIAAALSLTVVLTTLAFQGFDAGGWLLCARYTARFSFFCFLLAFLTPKWIPNVGDQESRDLFLAFAAAHFVHFGALMKYLSESAIEMNTGQETVGALAYLILVSLVIWLVRGRRFHRFHGPLVHYILLVFALTYGSRLPNEESRIVGIVGVGTAILALALRHLPKSAVKTNPQA